MTMKTGIVAKNGFSLIESLLALTFFLLIILSSIEFFGSARTLFFKLRDSQWDRESALAALEKLKGDLLHAGQGLLPPIRLGLLEGIGFEDGALILKSAIKTGVLSEDARAGQTAIKVENAEDFDLGRSIYLFDRDKGESRVIAAADGPDLTLTSPLAFGYLKEEGSVALVQTISYYLDMERSTLRRRVNSGISQPVLEGVQAFSAGLTGGGRLAVAGLRLRSKPDTPYEMAVVPKNLALMKEP